MKALFLNTLLTLSLFLLFNTTIKAQFECGTSLSNENQFEFSNDDFNRLKNLAQKNGDDEFVIKLNIVVLGQKFGLTKEIENAVAEVNEYFVPIGIYFETCEINSSLNLPEINTDIISTYFESLEQLGFINIYVASQVYSNDKYVCGFTYRPNYYSATGNNCRIAMDWDCFDRKTLIHEFGHLFGLSHTHGNSNTIKTEEWANGCNCQFTGDGICDTPADPNLLSKVSENCYYIGNELDQFGYPYNPPVENFMSYAGICRNEFTAEQYERMLYTFHIIWKESLTFECLNLEEPIIHEIPSFTYIDSPPIPFDQQYSISGLGVSDNSFHPGKAGIGKHKLYYTNNHDFLLSNYINPVTRRPIFSEDTLWQSFSPNHNGVLETLLLPIYPINGLQENVNFNVYLYEGIGIEGTKLYETTLPISTYSLLDFNENQVEYLSCLTEVSIPSIPLNPEKKYSIQIQSEPTDSIFYIGYQQNYYNELFELGYESSLKVIQYYEADTIYRLADTIYYPIDTIFRPADTFVYYPDLTGLDSNCFSYLSDTSIWPADTIYPDTLFALNDTIYVDADTFIIDRNIGLSTFISLNEENICQTKLKTIEVLPSPVLTHPNPAVEYLNLDYVQNEQLHPISFEVYSINGKKHHQESLPPFNNNFHDLNQVQLKIDVANIPSGLYVASVIYEEGVFAKRFVKL